MSQNRDGFMGPIWVKWGCDSRAWSYLWTMRDQNILARHPVPIPWGQCVPCMPLSERRHAERLEPMADDARDALLPVGRLCHHHLHPKREEMGAKRPTWITTGSSDCSTLMFRGAFICVLPPITANLHSVPPQPLEQSSVVADCCPLSLAAWSITFPVLLEKGEQQ